MIEIKNNPPKIKIQEIIISSPHMHISKKILLNKIKINSVHRLVMEVIKVMAVKNILHYMHKLILFKQLTGLPTPM